MSQIALLGPSIAPTIGEARDSLDRHYTPDALALCCARALVEHGCMSDRSTVYEPSVGGGAFVRAVRALTVDAEIHGWDVDPNAPGLALCDYANVQDWTSARPADADLVIGNPPFSGIDAIPHVERAIVSAQFAALILPWAPLGGVAAWFHVMSGKSPPAVVWPIAPRPWSEHVRETALYLWKRGERVRTQIAPPLVWR